MPGRSCRWLANTVACGVMTPSQPPDQTIGILAMSASLRLPFFSSTRRNASSARMRVKSLTPPLPSVLPITAITSSAANWPLAMQASRPDASLTVFSSTFATSIAIPKLRLLMRGLASPLSITSYPGPRSIIAGVLSRLPRMVSRSVAVASASIAWSPPRQHHAIVVARGLGRHLALDHVALHQLRLALERIAPAAAAGRHDAHDLPGQHRLAVDQAAEVARLRPSASTVTQNGWPALPPLRP